MNILKSRNRTGSQSAKISPNSSGALGLRTKKSIYMEVIVVKIAPCFVETEPKFIL